MWVRRAPPPAFAHAGVRGWIILALASLVTLTLAGFVPLRPRTTGVGDLMPNINMLETTLHNPSSALRNNACGVAAAAIILDYYQLDYQLPATQTPISIDAAARFVREGPSGTRTDYLQEDLVTAEASLDPQIPLTDSWKQTDSTDWFATLQAELTHNLPVILFIPNGHNLGWNFNWGHFIVVSGSTDDGGIIYHDPWDGTTHTKSGADFAHAWGTPFNDPNDNWIYKYLEILPPGVASPVPAPTGIPTTPSANQPHTLFAINHDGTLTSYDAATGHQHWKFAPNGGLSNIAGDTSTMVIAAAVQPNQGIQATGPLYGIDRATGKLQWQSSDSVAVLGMHANQIYVGAAVQNQQITALDAATGKPLWTAGVSPAPGGFYATDTTVFLSFSDATGQHDVIEALSAATGHPLWQRDLAAGPIPYTDAYEAGQIQAVDGNMVFVTSSNATGPVYVESFNITTGTRVWVRQLAGQSTFASLLVGDGIVVVEAGTGELATAMTVLNEQTGQPAWNLPITCGMTVPFIAGTTVYIYCTSQNSTDLYALSAAGGSIRWRQTVANTVADEASNGVQAVQDSTVYYQTCVASFSSGTVACKVVVLNGESGAIRWQSPRQFWGNTANAVITTGGTTLSALNVQDGAPLWSVPFASADSFNTSVMID